MRNPLLGEVSFGRFLVYDDDMPRYVILEHDYPQLHWDFMLEAGSVLRTWKLNAPLQPGTHVPAESSFDHRIIYLDYEGPLSGGRGSVTRWDHGNFRWEANEINRIGVVLEGARLHGQAVFRRHPDATWSLIYTPTDH